METKDILKTVEEKSEKVTGIEVAVKQYDTSQHEVFDARLRKKKELKKPTGQQDAKGNEILSTTFEEVVRIGLPLQKLIVKRRVAFMNVGKITINANTKDNAKGQQLLNMVKKAREDNKLQFKAKELATRMMSELHCAALWFTQPVEKGYWGEDAPNGNFKLRMKVLSPLLGDNLLPVFDDFGDLVYFGRGYKTKAGVETLDIYTKEGYYHFEKSDNGWSGDIFTKYSYGKIPIIYYKQDKAEWTDVQPAITRLETAISNLGDTNDYNGSPILAVTGRIKGFASKGERGKTLELDQGADIKYVNWDSAPESIKMEIDLLINFIYTATQTPNISFDEMKGLGALSGVAFDRVFLDAHLAAQDKLDGIFGECVQREINFLKAACISINPELKSEANLQITPEFPLFRINDDSETADFWLKASGSKPLVSQRTAIERAGFVPNADDEMKIIENEQSPYEKKL